MQDWRWHEGPRRQMRFVSNFFFAPAGVTAGLRNSIGELLARDAARPAGIRR
jgi:hypothetical protein